MPNYTIQDYLQIKRATTGSISHDEKYLAYLSNAPGTMQLFLQDLESLETPARQLTTFADSLYFALFSPTENVVAFGKASGGNEHTQIYLYNITTNEIQDITNNPSAIHRFGGWSRDGKLITYASNKRNGTDFDVYVYNLETGQDECVYESSGWSDSAGISPSGKWVAVRQVHTFTDHNLLLINRHTKESLLATPHAGPVEYGSPRWLPDESGFFYTSNEGRDFKSLAFYNCESRQSNFVFTPEWDIDESAITRDGTKIAIGVNEDGYQRVYILDTKTLTPLPVDLPTTGMVDSFRFACGGTKLVFDFESPTQTSDVWLLDITHNTTQQITQSENSINQSTLLEPELIHFPSFDGRLIPAFIFLPHSVEVGKKIPTIIHIHGGPEGQYQATFSGLTHYFTSKGFAIVAPNIRGSSGYGKAYLALDDIKKRPDTFTDLEYLHKYLSSRADVDPSRIALMGGSYGGYMTLAGLAFQPTLWAAGVDIVGMSSLTTFLENTSAWRRKLREAEYGYLETDREFLESISPLNKITAIVSPLFIAHGANDPRVPLSEAEQIHSQLQALGRQSELVVYADEGHGIAKLQNRLDLYPKIAEFLHTHLQQNNRQR